MALISSYKFIGGCMLVLVLGVSGIAQTRGAYPQDPNSTIDPQCLNNPALPGCNQRDMSQRPSLPTRTGPEQGPVVRIGTEPVQGVQDNPRTILNTPDASRNFAGTTFDEEEEPTEFQQFVQSSLNKKIPLFGHNLFKDVPSTFAPANRVPVSAEYALGPGDELLIRAWGQIDVDARVVVDRSGAIYLPRVGSVNVAGVQYKQLPDFLRTNIGRVFRNFDLTVTMGQLRSIPVYVVGQAQRPGVYTISALSTLVNAIFASGGPSSHGSMRHIQLKRSGETVTDFDLYDLLLKGDMSKDVRLLPGDVISIPPVGPQVAISGSVNLPAIYELAGNTNLKDAVELAGGMSSVADGDHAIVERIDKRSVRTVEEFKLDAQGMNRELRDGDLVRIFRISPRFENTVTIRGNVARPGRYPFREGMRIRDLIPNRDFLVTPAYWETQNAATTDKTSSSLNANMGARTDRPDRSDMEKGDLSRERDAKDLRFDSSSLQQMPDDLQQRYPNQRVLKADDLKNDVKRNAPEINWDYAVIQRLDPSTLSTTLIPFNLGKVILESSDADNLPLAPGDIVTIFSQRDIAVSIEKQSKFVRLEGEIRSPGIYKVEPGETLRDVVKRAGGLTDQAYLYGAQFTRESVRVDQQHSLEEMVRSLEMELQRKAIYNAQARPDQQANALAQSQADQAYVDKLRRVKPSGRIVLELQPTQTSINNIPEVALEDGDRFIVPYKPSTVTVVGAVNNQSSFIFRSGSDLKKYISLAGNGTRDADNKHMFVIRADGSVVSRDQASGFWGGGFESLRALPGDMVVVPTQLDKGSFMRGLKDWSQVISQFGLGVAAVYVLTK